MLSKIFYKTVEIESEGFEMIKFEGRFKQDINII